MSEPNDIDLIGELSEIMGDIASDGIESFKRGIEEKGLVMSEALLNSFISDVMREGFHTGFSISFFDYFRFKDRKILDYSKHLPPVDAMEQFVLYEGIDKFSGILSKIAPKRIPSASVLAKRIALQIIFSRRKVPIVQRKFSGTAYNSRKMRLINTTSYKARSFVAGRINAYYAEIIAQNDE